MSLRCSLFLKRIRVCLCLVVLAMSATSLKVKRPPFAVEASARAPVASAATQEQSEVQDIQGLVIAIRPNGFSPAQIEVTDGSYVLVVQNRSGLRDLTFQLDQENGERLHQVRAQRLQWKKAFDLHPGTYVLSVVDHPDWQCLIKVKPH